MTSKEVRNPGKGPNYSVNWTCGNSNIEVIDAMKGKVQDTQRPSRLCKFSMFQRWTKLAANKSLLKREEVPPHVPSLYSEAKMGSSKFQKAKQLLFKVKFVQPVFYFSVLVILLYSICRHSRKQNWEIGSKSPWNKMNSRFSWTWHHFVVSYDQANLIIVHLLRVFLFKAVNSAPCQNIYNHIIISLIVI